MYAIIEGGVVVNVIFWDGKSEWSPPSGSSIEDISQTPQVSIGWTWNGSAFSAPATS